MTIPTLPPAPPYLPGVADWPVLTPEDTVALLLQHPNAGPALDTLLDDLLRVERRAKRRAARLRGRMRWMRRIRG